MRPRDVAEFLEPCGSDLLKSWSDLRLGKGNKDKGKGSMCAGYCWEPVGFLQSFETHTDLYGYRLWPVMGAIL